ncbi:MIT domain-containing protein 1-like [Rhagoletis pomonella]|uniref:MIT domain-containing protein 1-like n=1 Tax=Rhagoletis pomonella TaxID=28610 RepID=UPI001780B554|nr:MIT domain-containing protein 1-like [Rhagoletis pomonella]
MNARDILKRAVQCDKAGRILEAQNLYQDGVQILMKIASSHINLKKKTVLYEHIKQYIDRAEEIKKRVDDLVVVGEVVKRLRIENDSTGNSYQSLFGECLDGKIKEVWLDEPYLQHDYQFQNLVIFLELVVKKCRNLKYIRLVNKTYRNAAQYQLNILEGLRADLGSRGINFAIRVDETLHDRRIALSNGYIIKIGRGLHFYKRNIPEYSLGYNDADFRKCLQTDLEIYRTKDFIA